MNTRMILPAILGAVMLGTPVLAASISSTTIPSGHHTQKVAAMTPSEQCTALQRQFDNTVKTHPAATKLSEAKAMATEGGSLCASGKQADGVAKLQQALKALGVKPKT